MPQTGSVQDFRKLRVWRAADDFTVAVYAATQGFPVEERFGLTAQLRRAAISIGANIAEGCGRGSRPDTARFLQVAIGSASEVSNYLHLARRLGYLSDDQYSALDANLIHIRRMLRRLMIRVRGKAPAQ